MTDEVTLVTEQGIVVTIPFFLTKNMGEHIVKEYLKAQMKTNQLYIDGMIQPDEFIRFSKSDQRWADNRKKSFQTREIKKGEVYQFEFGKNFIPEMSYEHRGLVIGVNKRLLHVLPIFSYDCKKHPDIYHPQDNPKSKSDLYLLKSNEYPFIQHDSVLKLNDIRTISINRALYKQKNGRIDIASKEFKDIEQLVFRKYFPEYAHEFQKLKADQKEQIDKMHDIEEKNNRLKVEIEKLKQRNKNENKEVLNKQEK